MEGTGNDMLLLVAWTLVLSHKKIGWMIFKGSESVSNAGIRDHVCMQMCKHLGQGIWRYAEELPGYELDPTLRPAFFNYITVNLQVCECTYRALCTSFSARKAPLMTNSIHAPVLAFDVRVDLKHQYLHLRLFGLC